MTTRAHSAGLAASPEPRRIVVVVDDPDAHAFLGRALEDRHRVEVVPDGHAALEAIGRQPPELALIALGRPQDGLDLLRRLRAEATTRALPVALLATRDEDDWRVQAFEAGADDYLVMPLGQRELLARLGRRLETFRVRGDDAIRGREPGAGDGRGRETPRSSGDVRFRTFLSQSRDGIVIIDGQGSVLEWNEGEERITGIPRAEVVGRPLWEVQHRLAPEETRTAERLHALREIVAGALRDGAQLDRTIEETIQRPDGSRRIIESRVFAVRGDGEAIAGGITRDITERRRLEEDLREGQAFLREAERLVHLGHFARDLRTGRGMWSDEVYRILGLAPGAAPTRQGLLQLIVPEDRERVADALDATAREGVPREGKFRITTPQGAARTLQASVGLLRDADGAPARIVGTVQDVTDRERAEEAVHASEARFRALVAASSEILCRLSPDWREMWELSSGGLLAEKDMPSRDWLRDYVHPDDQARVAAAVEQASEGKGWVELEHRVRLADGSTGWLQSRAVPIRNARGDVVEWFGAASNITGRKRAEEALRVSEERLRAHMDNSPLAVVELDPDFRLKRWSRQAERLFGWSADEVLGRAVGEMRWVHDDDLESLVREWAGLREGERPRSLHVHRNYRKDGSLVHCEWYSSALYGADGSLVSVLSQILDVSERKQAADAIRRSEEKFRTLFAMSPVAIVLNHLDTGRFIESNPALWEMTGYSEDEYRRLTYWDITPARYAEMEAKQLELLRTIGKYGPYEKEYVCKDGSLLPVLLSGVRITDPSGRDLIFSTIQDISELRRKDQALRESELRLRLANKATNDVIWDWDVVNDARRWNEAAKTVFGWTEVVEHPVPARWWLERVHPEDRERVGAKFSLVVNDPEADHWSDEYRFRRADGSLAQVVDRGYVLRNADGEAVRMIGAMHDITERKQAEEALLEADRRKNQFLAMLSHELRNPLAPIRNSLYILDHTAPGSEQARRATAIIDRQVTQMTRLVEELLDVTRITRGKIELKRERLDLGELVLRTVEDHRGVFVAGGIELKVGAAPAALWIDGDRARLAQAVGNLLHNATKFTPRGGSTTVSIEADAARSQAVVTVRDTGIGFPPEMVPRLFEAFAQADTSLDRSRGGLGLGLALVKGLVEMHGGLVGAASEGVGKGAVFTVRLPLGIPRAEIAGERPGDHGTRSPRRVLVIEDDQDAAESLREALELGGHVVAVAPDGPGGLERARALRPDVVFCDIGLAGMDGYAVARALRADPERGGVTLVALTGYAGPEDVARAREAGFDAHLAKPPSMDAIEEVLAASRPGGGHGLSASP